MARTPEDKLRLGLFINPTGHHQAAWRSHDSQADASVNLQHYIGLIRRRHLLFLIPFFLGWLVVGETITLRTILAAAIILAAVLLVITAPHRQPAPAATALPEPAEA